ncbi:galactose oxidase [Parapedobacter sp. 10938]|uniref:galactose oxidase n=1 Tax=Parapedobacter flavus TaxID=3110225 RepID=UPI002DB78303|nr:galactose oxidase [Parapedobacter sp. 10938]MEC3878988.1 galactose oxidase [Parapedobacter sp. 10938]
MTKRVGNIWLPVMVFTMIQACENKGTVTHFDWQQLQQLPDAVGFAGAYAGVSNGHLLVAGGANFPEGTRPWSGGVKQWSDQVFVFKADAGEWERAGSLPRPMGYGVSVVWRDSLIIIGGSDRARHYADVFAITYTEGELKTSAWPSLPAPLANTCGALVGDVIYVAGGLSSPIDTTASNGFFALDLSKPAAERRWETLESWPGAPRMLAVAGAMGDGFYLLSGVSLSVNPGDSLPTRTYLVDAFRYEPQVGWTEIADLPHAVAAAPSPAFTTRNDEVLVFGGDDGRLAPQAGALKDRHPGFSTDILAYDLATDSWRVDGKLPVDKLANPENDPNASTWAPVTTTGVVWNDHYILPMGEVRPGVRTNRVLAVKCEAK